MRIAIAGFQHETNTFVARNTPLEDFMRADSWPELLEGRSVIEKTKGMNLPIAGFAEAAIADGAELVPILWCAAEPSGRVEDKAYATLTQRIVDEAHRLNELDWGHRRDLLEFAMKDGPAHACATCHIVNRDHRAQI